MRVFTFLFWKGRGNDSSSKKHLSAMSTCILSKFLLLIDEYNCSTIFFASESVSELLGSIGCLSQHSFHMFFFGWMLGQTVPL